MIYQIYPENDIFAIGEHLSMLAFTLIQTTAAVVERRLIYDDATECSFVCFDLFNVVINRKRQRANVDG